MGCVVQPSVSTVPSVRQEEPSLPLQVVTTSNIVADWIREVGDDRVAVTALLPPGSDPHTFQPGAKDIARVADADLVVTVGLSLEAGWLDKLLVNAARAPEHVVAIGEAITPIEAAAWTGHDDHHEDMHEGHEHEDMHEGHEHEDMHEGHEHEDMHEGHEHEDMHEGHEHEDMHEGHEHEDMHEGHEHEDMHEDHEHEDMHKDHEHEDMHKDHEHEDMHEDHEHGDMHKDHEHEDMHGHDAHDHGPYDPHFWLDPQRVQQAVHALADQLAVLDPDGATLYHANAEAYSTELDELHHWIQDQVSVILEDQRLLVTNHDSFQYFAQLYGFEVVGAVFPGMSTEREPSAQEIAALIDHINATGAQALFTETIAADTLAQRIADETGATVVSTLYTGSLSAAEGEAGTYLDYMRYNVVAIVEALRPHEMK